MNQISHRVPDIDFSQGIDRHWNDGCPIQSHAFNALSLLFPLAEKFFVDVVKEVSMTTNLTDMPELRAEIEQFISQESMHNLQHKLFNRELHKLGYVNPLEDYQRKAIKIAHTKYSPIMKLALVCGFEHFTAILGAYVLQNPQLFSRADDDIKLLWEWHAAEETEHKSVCLDLYRVAKGGWFRRTSVFIVVSLDFFYMYCRLYWGLLKKDGYVKQQGLFSSIGKTVKFFFQKNGMGRYVLRYGLTYISPNFHPWQQDNSKLLAKWLLLNEPRLKKSKL